MLREYAQHDAAEARKVVPGWLLGRPSNRRHADGQPSERSICGHRAVSPRGSPPPLRWPAGHGPTTAGRLPTTHSPLGVNAHKQGSRRTRAQPLEDLFLGASGQKQRANLLTVAVLVEESLAQGRL